MLRDRMRRQKLYDTVQFKRYKSNTGYSVSAFFRGREILLLVPLHSCSRLFPLLARKPSHQHCFPTPLHSYLLGQSSEPWDTSSIFLSSGFQL